MYPNCGFGFSYHSHPLILIKLPKSISHSSIRKMGYSSASRSLADFLTIRRWDYCAIAGGGLTAVCILIGFATSGNIPPTRPWWDAETVHEHYWSHVKGTQVGAIFMMMSSGFYMVFSAAIARQLRQIPDIDPILPDLQLAAGAASCCPLIVSSALMSLLTFRDYGPQLTQFINDFMLLGFLLSWPIFWVQMWTTSWAVLSDKKAQPVLPKSVALINLAAPVVFALGAGSHIHHTGPMPWNGGLVFWPTFVFFRMQVTGDCLFMWKNVQKEVSVF